MLERSRSRSRSRTRTKKIPASFARESFFPWRRQNRVRHFCPGIFFCDHRSDQDQHMHTCSRLTLIILRLTTKGQSLCRRECHQEREDHLEASKRIRRAHHSLPCGVKISVANKMQDQRRRQRKGSKSPKSLLQDMWQQKSWRIKKPRRGSLEMSRSSHSSLLSRSRPSSILSRSRPSSLLPRSSHSRLLPRSSHSRLLPRSSHSSLLSRSRPSSPCPCPCPMTATLI